MKLIEESGGFSSIYKSRVAMAAQEVLAIAFNVPLGQITMQGRQRAGVAAARQIAMYLCHVVGQLSLREVALEFEREVSTVSHACHVVEDRRENQIFDRHLAMLEEELRSQIRVLIDGAVRARAELAAKEAADRDGESGIGSPKSGKGKRPGPRERKGVNPALEFKSAEPVQLDPPAQALRAIS